MEELMDKLKGLLNNFELAKFLPKLDTIVGVVELVTRICVMTAPLILLALGLIYFLSPPREANHRFGYRCFFGMGSVEAWHFTQRLAGIVWSVLGLGLTIAMALICNGYRDMEVTAMMYSAIRCLLWQLCLSAASILVLNLTVLLVYDFKGNRRLWRKEPKAEKKEN